ncbi:MAG TPA: MFS transporter [Actinoplanes sp.]|nr:MFS transporter [Actinoplanes sp.]
MGSRTAQGVGAALLAPAALALLTATFPTGKPRVRAFGVWSAMNAAGGALGVLIGGFLTQYAGWQWVMFVSVPMAAVTLVLVGRGVGAVAPVAPGGHPDVLGAVLATAGMMLLVFGIVRTDRHPWGSAVTLTTFAVTLVLLAAFVLVEHTTSRDPLVRPGLLANRSLAPDRRRARSGRARHCRPRVGRIGHPGRPQRRIRLRPAARRQALDRRRRHRVHRPPPRHRPGARLLRCG